MDPDTTQAGGGSSEQNTEKASVAASAPSEPPSPGRVLRTRVPRRTHCATPTGTPCSGRVLRDRSARRPSAGRNLEGDRGTESQASRRRSAAGRLGPPGEAGDERGLGEESAGNNSSLRKAARTSRGRQRAGSPRPSRHLVPLVCKSEPDHSKALGIVKAEDDNDDDDDDDDDDVLVEEDPPFRDDPSDLNYKPEDERDPPKPRRRVSRHKEDKKDKDQERDKGKEIKTEGAAEIEVKLENEFGEETELPRKRGRRRKDDQSPRLPKRRKKPPVQYVRCEMEGCGTVLAHPRYLQHHIKYQHLLMKKYVCPHPSCGRLFRLQKQLLRHAKHHTDQRDYICEYCARAFKSSHNLAVHRMIHTGEKPLQCEICGFTCRQKASLNWHMKKHDADAFYQFSCSICGKKFEKKDSVVAHKAKSHPEVLIAEALAANAGALITTPTPLLEALPGTGHAEQTEETLAPQQVMPPVPPPSQAQILTLPPQPVTLLPQGLALTTVSTLASAPTGPTDTIPGVVQGEAWEGAAEAGGLRDEGSVMWERQGGQEGGDSALAWAREDHSEVLLEGTEVPGQPQNHQGLM
ncbi:hypothetical protein GN956_G10285 [Arapaima gigas]